MKKVVLGAVAIALCLNSCKLTVNADEGFSKFLHETEIEVQTADAGFTKFIQDIQPELIVSTEYTVPEYSGFKSYMTYKNFGKTSDQYKLQQLASTDEHGFRKVDDCYMIAVGNYFDTKVGQRIDLKLENGEVIKCIVGDKKADKDTDKTNMFSKNDCLSEFLVDIKLLNKEVKNGGDVSLFPEEEWDSPVVEVVVYEEFMLEG